MMLALNVVKIDSKIIILLLWSKSMKQTIAYHAKTSFLIFFDTDVIKALLIKRLKIAIGKFYQNLIQGI